MTNIIRTILFLSVMITFLQTNTCLYNIIDTVSETRGIDTAKRCLYQLYHKIATDCNNCLEVFYQKDFVMREGNEHVPKDVSKLRKKLKSL